MKYDTFEEFRSEIVADDYNTVGTISLFSPLTCLAVTSARPRPSSLRVAASLAALTVFLDSSQLRYPEIMPTSLFKLQVLVAALAVAQSFPTGPHYPTHSTTTSSSSSSSSLSRRIAFVSNTSSQLFSSLEEVAVTQQQQQRGEKSSEKYITARGDGTSGGGGVPMKKSTRQPDQDSLSTTTELGSDNEEDSLLVRPKVGAPMPFGRPSWFRVPAPSDSDKSRYVAVKESLSTLSLNTVCEEAQCPNIGECWNGGTGTIMLLGDTCTRGCMFCAVKTDGKPPEPDPFEPFKVTHSFTFPYILWRHALTFMLCITHYFFYPLITFQDCRGCHKVGSRLHRPNLRRSR